MLGMSPLQLSATLAAVVASRPPFSLLAAAAPGATGPAQASKLASALLLVVTGFSKPAAAQPIWMSYPSDQLNTWAVANATCSEAGGRLCTYAEYCPNGLGGQPDRNIPGNSNSMFDSGWSKYGPTSHGFNDWVTISPPPGHSSQQTKICRPHLHTYGPDPNWGYLGSSEPYLNTDAFCCNRNAPPLPRVASPAPDPALCSNVVYCMNNQAHADSYFDNPIGKTCTEACNGNCCVSDTGDNACSSNTRFMVCADDDDGSCTGVNACTNVGMNNKQSGHFPDGEVGLISGGSCVGKNACTGAGKNGGQISSISDGSCVGDDACHRLASFGGIVGNVADSCEDNLACLDLAHGQDTYYGIPPVAPAVGDVIDACKGESACQGVGFMNAEPQGLLHSCCNSPNECQFNGCKNSHLYQHTYLHYMCPNSEGDPVPASCIATPAPTPVGPFDLHYDNVEANFTSGASNELEVGFFVGVGHAVNVEVFQTCDKGAEQVSSSLYNKNDDEMVSPDPTEANLTHSKITVGYNFNKTQMIDSSLWNSTSEKLKFCQVTSLTVPDPDGGDAWVITEDRREIEIRFDLTANFIVNVTLADETIKSANETVSFDEQVRAIKCQGGGTDPFAENYDALPPNTQLAICIISDNLSVNLVRPTDVVIEQESESVDVVDSNGDIVIPAITEVDVVSAGIMITTRAPLDKFIFETGKNITISGKVELELANGRRLRALSEENAAAAEQEEAGYTVTVNLLSEGDGMSEVQAPIGSSAGYTIGGKSLGALGLMISAVIGLLI